MAVSSKEAIKKVLGQLPFTAELYWLVRQREKPPKSRFGFRHFQETLPQYIREAAELRATAPKGKKVFLFSSIHYWIEHTSMLGLSLAALGHDVSLGFLPYGDYRVPTNRFDLRRQNIYTLKVLGQAEPLIKPVAFINIRYPGLRLPENIMEAVREITTYDVQYISQVEEVDPQSAIYKLRWETNLETAQAAYAYFNQNKPDVAIIPNGSILEPGVVFRVAKAMGIRAVTYEFGEQKQRIWLAVNDEIMRQNTDGMWEALKDQPLTPDQLEKVKNLYAARKQGMLWENFSRKWQGGEQRGSAQVRESLGLDNRPVALLATNVVGDSLTLGRQLYSKTMTEWIIRTVQYFAGRPDAQLVIRIHPGEVLMNGLSVAQTIRQTMPKLPDNIHLVAAKDTINTYDLIGIADLGLVYTTTAGMEMALSGVPVIVNGKTHYRNRGFTIDPDSWVNYFKLMGQALEKPESQRLTQAQVELAWKYAYHFFFDFPKPFPWHLTRMAEDFKNHSLRAVVGPEGLEQYAEAFRTLLGEPLAWK